MIFEVKVNLNSFNIIASDKMSLSMIMICYEHFFTYLAARTIKLQTQSKLLL